MAGVYHIIANRGSGTFPRAGMPQEKLRGGRNEIPSGNMGKQGWSKLLVFESTHRALQAEEALKAAGVRHRVIPKPAVVRADCGIAILVAPEVLADALAALAPADAAPAGTYDYHRRVVKGFVENGGGST
jgi:hypothetical protein